jgi:DNA-binding NtrC family response regulator
MAKKILVIDDEKLIRWTLERHLVKEGYEVVATESAEKGLQLIAEETPDLVLLDNQLPEMTGLELLGRLNVRERGLMVIMITAHGLVEAAVQAVKLGAYDYISKPFNLEEISFIIRKALETGSLRNQVKQLRGRLDSIIGETEQMVHVKNLIEKVARSDATTVLIQGESGTGKELVAKAIHYGSSRADNPFQTINCAAMPITLLETELMGHEKGAFTDARTAKKGLFELADGGSLFLDEIGDMDLNIQAKLLRVLEEKSFRRVGGVKDLTVDVRVISATNQDLGKAMGEGKFRKDLYYRLQVVTISLPPLRQRGDDILLLARHFINHYNCECHKNVKGVSPDAERIMLGYPWPGNVRELRNAIERAMIFEIESEVLPEHLPQELIEFQPSPAQPEPMSLSLDCLEFPETGISIGDVERALVMKALEMAQGNQTRAAQLVKMPRDAFRRRMRRFGLL